MLGFSDQIEAWLLKVDAESNTHQFLWQELNFLATKLFWSEKIEMRDQCLIVDTLRKPEMNYWSLKKGNRDQYLVAKIIY